MKLLTIALMISTIFASSHSNAAFIDNGNYTTDTSTGLDWLKLSETTGTSYNTALDSLSSDGWRYATNTELDNIFWQIFVGYFDTNVGGETGLNYSSTWHSWHYANQMTDAAEFQSVFGLTSNTETYTESYGMYIDEDDRVTIMGLYNDGVNSEIYGMEFNDFYTADEIPWGGIVGVYAIRTTVVPVPAAAWLFASGLIGLAGIGRRKKK